jgi:hypothetical protein
MRAVSSKTHGRRTSWDLSVGPVRPLAWWRRRASLNCLWRQPGATLGAVDVVRDRQRRIVADLFMTPQEVKSVMRCPSDTRPRRSTSKEKVASVCTGEAVSLVLSARTVRQLAFPLVSAYVVGLGGLEPPASSLSAKYREPVCGGPVPQVASDRRGRSYRARPASPVLIMAAFCVLSTIVEEVYRLGLTVLPSCPTAPAAWAGPEPVAAGRLKVWLAAETGPPVLAVAVR